MNIYCENTHVKMKSYTFILFHFLENKKNTVPMSYRTQTNM